MMNAYKTALLSVVLLSGCVLVPEEARYLRSAKDHATQADVRQQLGAPQRMVQIDATEQVWVYDRYSLEPGAQSTWASSGSQCDQYVLQFDGTGVLRRWTHDNYRHGAENMPRECISAAEHWRRSDVSAGYRY